MTLPRDLAKGNYIQVHLARSRPRLSELPSTGRMKKGTRKMKNLAGERKRGIKRSPVVLCCLLMNTRNRFRFLLPKLFQAGYLRHLDCPPMLPSKVREAEARSNGPVQSCSTPQMTSHSRTQQASWSPRAEREITLPQSR